MFRPDFDQACRIMDKIRRHLHASCAALIIFAFVLSVFFLVRSGNAAMSAVIITCVCLPIMIGGAYAAIVTLLDAIVWHLKKKSVDAQTERDMKSLDYKTTKTKPVRKEKAAVYEEAEFERPELTVYKEEREYPKVRAKMSLDGMSFTDAEIREKIERARNRRRKTKEGGEGSHEIPG